MWLPPRKGSKSRRFIKRSDKRINIAHGPVRSGKTVDSIQRWMMFIRNAPPGDLLMIGKTERTLEKNICRPMQEFFPLKDVSFRYGAGRGKILGRTVDLVGFNNVLAETKIRGSTVAGWYGDEITTWPESAFEMLTTRQSVAGSMGFGTTNPDGPKHWLKRDWLDNPALEPNLFQLGYKLGDNEHLEPDFVEFLKSSYSGLFYKRFILGLWVAAEGAIYDMFDEDKNVFSGECPFVIDHYVTGIDYATSSVCTFGLYGVGQGPRFTGKLALLKEYRWDVTKEGRQKTDAAYVKDYIKFIDGYEIRKNYVDPSAASLTAALRDEQLEATPANNDVLEGISHVSTMLENIDFVISELCTDTIPCYQGYVWDPKASDKGEDKPLKKDDHECDRDRYVAYSHLKKSNSLIMTA